MLPKMKNSSLKRVFTFFTYMSLPHSITYNSMLHFYNLLYETSYTNIWITCSSSTPLINGKGHGKRTCMDTLSWQTIISKESDYLIFADA